MFLVEHFVLLYFKLLFLFIISSTFCLLYFKLLFLLLLVEHFVYFILSYYFLFLFYVFSGAFSFALF